MSYREAVLDVAANTNTPLAVLASVPSAIDAETAQWLRGNGIPVLESASSGLAALGHLARWPLPIDGTRATVQPERRDRWRARAADGISVVELLTDYGVPVLMSRPALPPD